MDRIARASTHALLWLVLLGTSFPVRAQTAPKGEASGQTGQKALIWRDPGAVESLDFRWGPSGPSNAPEPPFSYVDKEVRGATPKVKVKDARGVTWSVKFEREAHAEVIASRIAWAAGYIVEPTYFVREGRIRGVGELKHAGRTIIDQWGSFKNARFEMRGGPKPRDSAGWKWDENPFLGTRELNGLKIIMMLTSNWDNKDAGDVGRGSNTSILDYDNAGESHYIVNDWGGSMGRWGGVTGRNKWNCKGYAKQTPEFIEATEHDGKVRWGYKGQHTKAFTNDISVSDVEWLLQYIGRITDEQIRTGLVASGATPPEVDCYASAIRDRINMLIELVENPERFQAAKEKAN